MPSTETDAEFIERVYRKCMVCADCWVWKAGRANGLPAIKTGGVIVNVRREILRRAGVRLDGMRAMAMCETALCVSPEHLAATRPATSIKRGMSAMSASARLQRSARISAKKRERSVLTPADVEAIRGGSLSCAEEAKSRGISKSVVIDIRSHAIWRDYNNPYWGLMK